MKTNLKLAKLWLDRKEYGRLGKIIRDLHASVKPEDPDSDQVDNSRGTLLLEILALEIQMYTETKNKKKLREIYDQSTQVKSAIPHPRIMGVIRECGGKMHMSERESKVHLLKMDLTYPLMRHPQATTVKLRMTSSRPSRTMMRLDLLNECKC